MNKFAHHIWQLFVMGACVVMIYVLGVALYKTLRSSNCSRYNRALITQVERSDSSRVAVHYKHYVDEKEVNSLDNRVVYSGEQSRYVVGDSVHIIYACDDPMIGKILPLQN